MAPLIVKEYLFAATCYACYAAAFAGTAGTEVAAMLCCRQDNGLCVNLFLHFHFYYTFLYFIFLLTVQVCGFIFPFASLGFLGQLPGTGRPYRDAIIILRPHHVHIYSTRRSAITIPNLENRYRCHAIYYSWVSLPYHKFDIILIYL